MKELCFGSFITVLVKCLAPTVSQKTLIGTMLLQVNSRYDICADDGATSALATGRKNLSDNVTLYLDEMTPKGLSDKFQKNVLCLLDANKSANIVLALKTIIAEDKNIFDTTQIEFVNGFTKADILTRETFVLAELIAGLFFYVAKYTRNDKREEMVREISEDFVNSFDFRRNEITFIDSYGMKNMDILNVAVSDADTLRLFAEESGQCPYCTKPLLPNKTIMVELEAGMDMLFCVECGTLVNNSVEKKDECKKIKTQYQKRMNAIESVSSNDLPDVIRDLIIIISSGEPITDSELRMSPLKLEKKITDLRLLRKIKAYVVDGMYEMVNEAIEMLAAENKLNVRLFERNIKRMYEDAEDLESQSAIFNLLVDRLYAKSGQKDYEACEILVSYFVQRCEVFNEITG